MKILIVGSKSRLIHLKDFSYKDLATKIIYDFCYDEFEEIMSQTRTKCKVDVKNSSKMTGCHTPPS